MPELDLKEDRKQQVEQLRDSEEEQEEEGGLDRKRHSIYNRTVRSLTRYLSALGF